VFQAWLTFAIFDNARRAHLGAGLDAYRAGIGALFAPMTRVAAANPHAWFRVERSADELVTVRPENRMVGYPYTKYVISIMDVDMASALLLATHERADALGVPADRRVYLRGWCYATDPFPIAEHDVMFGSPAMAAASGEALRCAGVGIDDVAHLDLYSCFASSVAFACDALGVAATDERPLTVTGGLPYHGGAGSGYMTHSIATMAEVLRADPGSLGMVSGVGMHMTKHVYGVYSSEPGGYHPPDELRVTSELERHPPREIVVEYEGDAEVAAYSVVHGRDGDPEWGVVVVDAPGERRAYGKVLDTDALAAAEVDELVGRRVRLTPTTVTTAMGEGRANIAVVS
jgi:acetyl-CoA C-acetyltransferase